MEDILSGLNGQNVLQLVVEELDSVQENVPIQSQKIKEKLVLNKTWDQLRKLESVTPRIVVRTEKHSFS